MPVPGEYTITWSDTSKTEFVVSPGSINSSTPITIYGKGYQNYGEGLQENLLHIMENFASPTSPSNPIEGLCWFDTSVARLKIYDGTKYVVVGSSAVASSIAPAAPEVGFMWYNTTTQNFNVWSGSAWVEFANATTLTNHINSSTLHLTTNEKTFVSNNATSTVVAAELDRVVGVTSPIQTQLNAKLDKTGGTLSGFVFTHADPTLDMHVANKRFVDTSIYQLSNQIFAGNVQYPFNDLYTTYASGTISTVTLPFNYNVGSNELCMFVSGIKMIRGYEYNETAASLLTLLGTVPSDTEISVFRNIYNTEGIATASVVVGTPNNSGLVRMHEFRGVSTASQVAFTKGTHVTDVGTNIGTAVNFNSARSVLWVFINGVKQVPGVAYNISAANTITFTTGLPNGAVVNVVQFILNTGGTTNPTITYELVNIPLSNTTVVGLAQPYFYNTAQPIDINNTAIAVFINGVYQGDDAYAETNGSGIVLSEGVAPGDKVEVYAFKMVDGVVA